MAGNSSRPKSSLLPLKVFAGPGCRKSEAQPCLYALASFHASAPHTGTGSPPYRTRGARRPEPGAARAGGTRPIFEADAEFVEAVMKGLASLDRGEGLTHEEVGKRIDRLFQA